jgi:glycerol-3-phosphate acyltransferase PlsX
VEESGGSRPAGGRGPRAVTIALDGRGADRGPGVIASGARAAAADGIAVRVFGDPAKLGELEGAPRIELIAAADEITNHDEPVAAVRSRPDASVVMAARDVAKGRSQAVVSAGSTGAAMTSALFALRRMHGVRRPALALQLVVPARPASPTLLLDVGANAECRPRDLVQFAYLGAAFSASVLAVERPRVALLSVGSEASKGTQTVLEAHARLSGADGIEFVGNVEGHDLLGDRADVIVTDGFTGNVALKAIEGTAKAVAGAVGAAARSNPVSALGGLMLRPALGGLRRQMNPDTTGGAILLGLRGVAVVAHGSSGGDGIANAVRLGARAVEQRAAERTAELLVRAGVTRGGLRDAEEAETSPAAAGRDRKSE